VVIIRAEELAEMLGCPSARAARDLARQSGFPPVVELSPGRRGWVRSEVEEWVESRKRVLPNSIDEVEIHEALLHNGTKGQRRGPMRRAA
jgi:predicted DNA-binding transcriptional regulator AlpA